MKKDAYYFPHYSNARNDAKLIKLRRVLGIEGYGIYFMILEVLRDQTDFSLPIDGVEDLAFEWHTSKEKIYSVINDYGLFDIDGESFRSDKLILYLQPYIEKSERARAAANLRWDAIRNANAYANALPEQCGSNADQNASKGEERRREEKRREDIKKPQYIYNHFYDSEIEKSKGMEKIDLYGNYVSFLFGNNELDRPLRKCLKMNDQIKYKRFTDLLEIAVKNKKSLSQITLDIENHKKGYESLSRSLGNWLSKQF